jgi:hypothetical protein
VSKRVADVVIKKKVCDNPRCVTPEEDVRRITSDLEGEGTVVVDVCKPDRDSQPITTVRKWAHKKIARRRGITVTPASEVPRSQ